MRMQEVEKIRMIGEGQCAEVYKVRWRGMHAVAKGSIGKQELGKLFIIVELSKQIQCDNWSDFGNTGLTLGTHGFNSSS